MLSADVTLGQHEQMYGGEPPPTPRSQASMELTTSAFQGREGPLPCCDASFLLM